MTDVIENGERVMCGECREYKTWLKIGKGKAAHSVQLCGCALPPAPVKQGRKKCSPRNAKAKGDGEEREIVKRATDWGYHAYRTAGSGAHGSRNAESAFATDVRIKCADRVWRVESKRHASVSGLKSLLKLKDNSEILWVREDFSEAYVLMSADTFAEFASLAAEALKK